MKTIHIFLYFLFHTRPFYSAFFCLKHLPFKQAIKIPIIFFQGARMKMRYHATIEIAGNPKLGQIRIGSYEPNFMKEGVKMTIYNDGKIIFGGTNISIIGGCNLHVTPSGILSIGQEVTLGSMGRLYCCKSIKIGKKTRFSHDFQLFDSGFHYLIHTETNEIKGAIAAPIEIGENCWIGNRTTINAGTKLPDGCIVGSNSLLNKDYTPIVAPNSILAGMPAKKISEGYSRLWDMEREAELFSKEGIIQN